MRRRSPLIAELVTTSEAEPCRFCGVRTTARHETYHLNGNHADRRPENLAAACALCHLCQHLDEAQAGAGAMLIWLPEMSQAALITIVRGMHMLQQTDADPRAARARTRSQGDARTGLTRAMAALQARADPARQVLGTSRPAVLGAALLALDPTSYRERAKLLDGIRLLPGDRLMRDGRDIYPELLRQWRLPEAPSRPRAAA